ncbi:MAG: transporter substrate-binding domain-containing protein, partial [Alkalinema sp. RU_4_3]|nr:transporter substrate-binding domain-containing protein [Alkalinema sp. RU_4_3]
MQLVASPFALAADLETIKTRGYLIVAVKDNLRPLGFRAATGELQGFEIDIAKRLAKDLLGREDAVKFLPVQNTDRITVLTEDKADVTIAHLTATAARSRLVYFTYPYYFEGTALLTPGPVKTPEAMAGKSIAVLRGAVNAEVAAKRAIPNVKLVFVESYGAAAGKITQRSVAGFVGDVSPLVGWQQEMPGYGLLPARGDAGAHGDRMAEGGCSM